MLKDAAIVPYIPVADLARARKFYEGTLGLVPKEEYAGGVIFEEYDLPGLKTVNSIATGGGAKTAWFKDSEGNILAVSQRLFA
jgi:hypothetical protein